jgi:hypothetical protein
MLQAALCAEMEFNNIRNIASEVYGGGGQAFPAQVNASQCKKTMTCYGSGAKRLNKSNSTSGHLPLCCYGCGGPHPWLLLENGIYVIKCPQSGDTRIAENARRAIDRIQARRKKEQHENKKRKNLATTNYADFDDESKEHIKQQVLQFVKVAINAASVCSSITGITGATSLLLLVLFMDVAAAKPSSSFIMPKFYKQRLIAQSSQLPSKARCPTLLSSLALTWIAATA